jgi:hypothetical protein
MVLPFRVVLLQPQRHRRESRTQRFPLGNPVLSAGNSLDKHPPEREVG